MSKVTVEEFRDTALPVPISANPSTLSAASYGYNTLSAAWRPTVLDTTSDTLATIDIDHYRIHSGQMFVSDWYPGDVAAAGSAVVFVETDATHDIHWFMEIETESEATFRLWETASYDTSGTRLLPRNRDRGSALSATVWLHHTPATPVTAGATILRTRHWGSGKDTGGAGRDSLEWVLKPSTKYMLVITNDSVSSAWIFFQASFYEVPPL